MQKSCVENSETLHSADFSMEQQKNCVKFIFSNEMKVEWLTFIDFPLFFSFNFYLYFKIWIE